MDEFKEIVYELKKLKKNIENNKVNKFYNDFINTNYYAEKKIIYNLFQIIKSYHHLLILFGKKKKKRKEKEKEKEKEIKHKDRNKDKNYVTEEIILKKLQKKKIVQHRHTKKIKEFLKANKSINIFKNYIKKKYKTQNNNNNKKKKRHRIRINIETNTYFNNFITHIINFLYFIFQSNNNYDNCSHNYYYPSKELRNYVNTLNKNEDCNYYNIINKESIEENEQNIIINKENKNTEDNYTISKGNNSQENNKSLKKYILFKEENILKENSLKIENSSNNKGTYNDSDITKYLHIKKENKDDKNGDENYFFFHLYKKNMYLINKNIEASYYHNSFIIRKIDSNLLYIIDNDVNLLKILFYFDVVNIFSTYLFIITCNKEEMCKYLSIFLMIIAKFSRSFKLSCNHLIENKNIPIIFYVFSNILKKNIINKNIERSNEKKLTTTIYNNTSNYSLNNTTLMRKNNLNFLKNLNELYVMKTMNDIKEINEIKKEQKTSLLSYENNEYNNDEKYSSILTSDQNIINKKINKTSINNSMKDKNKKKNEYNNKSEIFHFSDERNLQLAENKKKEKKGKKFFYQNLYNYYNIKKNTSNEKDVQNNYYYFYSLIKEEYEIDSVNLTLSINKTKDENVFFYKNYISEHIYNLFLNKYNLKLKKNSIVSNEEKKEENNNKSLFDNYKKLFHNFFFIKNIL